MIVFGGPDRDRTDDLVIANDALSQLSYRPVLPNGEGLYDGGCAGCQASLAILIVNDYCANSFAKKKEALCLF